MYRLLIAEDEPLEREGLLHAVKRLCPEIGSAWTAENGREAIALAERFNPDICILDIKMPGIDGIEAARQIRERRGETQIIFLTAFDQFEYARDALRLGASEFLVKPAEDEEVATAVAKAAERLGELKAQGETRDELSRTLETLTPLAERQLMERLFVGGEDSLERIAALLGAREEAVILVVRLTPSLPERLDPVPGRMEARMRRLRRELSTVARGCGYLTIPWLAETELRLALLPEGEALFDGELSGRIEAELEEFRRRESVTLRGILTEKSSRAEELARWATEASATLEGRTCSPAILLRQGGVPSAQKGVDRYDLERRLLVSIRRGRAEEVRRLGDRLLEQAEGDAEGVRMLREELTYLAHALRVPAVGLQESPGYREQFLMALEELRRRHLGSVPLELSPVVRRVRKHIDHHYMEELTLELLARTAAVSEFYLSRLFKRETGQTVVGYITERRLAAARELLSEGVLSVKEVSARSGFADPSYFSRVFSRREGVSPSDFRRQRIAP